jgi:hypothetical protein
VKLIMANFVQSEMTLSNTDPIKSKMTLPKSND